MPFYAKYKNLDNGADNFKTIKGYFTVLFTFNKLTYLCPLVYIKLVSCIYNKAHLNRNIPHVHCDISLELAE